MTARVEPQGIEPCLQACKARVIPVDHGPREDYMKFFVVVFVPILMLMAIIVVSDWWDHRRR